MPSVWNLVGVEARTALTVFVFQISTASGDTGVALCVVAEAADNDTVAATMAATTRMPTRMGSAFGLTVLIFIAPPHLFELSPICRDFTASLFLSAEEYRQRRAWTRTLRMG